MKKSCALFVTLIFVLGLAVSPVFAGGDKNQIEHEGGQAEGPAYGNATSEPEDGGNPGSDAQGNQAD
jgi:hypothetical protein